MLKQIANEVWKKCMDEMSKDDNKKMLDNYIYKNFLHMAILFHESFLPYILFHQKLLCYN